MRRVNPVRPVLTFLLNKSLKTSCGGFVNTIPHQKVLSLTVEVCFLKKSSSVQTKTPELTFILYLSLWVVCGQKSTSSANDLFHILVKTLTYFL